MVLTASVFEWAPPPWRLLHDSNLSGFDFSQISMPFIQQWYARPLASRC